MNKIYQEVLLGDILEQRQETPNEQAIFNGEIPIISKISFLDGKIEYRTDRESKTQLILIKPGDFVLSGINAAKGAIAIHDEKNLFLLAATIHYTSYIPKKDRVDIRYLWWLLRSQSFRDLLNMYLPGGVKTELRAKYFLPIPIPLPPLEEQRRIVARIEELAAKIEEARGLRREAAEETNTFISSSRARFFENALQQNVQKLSDLAILERGKFSHRPRNDPYFFGGKHPWIQIAEIEQSSKYIHEWTQTLNDEGLNVSKKFPKGTLLISIAATIGSVGILDFDCCIPDSIVAIMPKPGIESEYLYHYFGYARNHLESLAPQSAQKNINLEILSSLPVPLLDISRQKDIILYLDNLQNKIDALDCHQAEVTAELDALLPSILDKAFKGEL